MEAVRVALETAYVPIPSYDVIYVSLAKACTLIPAIVCVIHLWLVIWREYDISVWTRARDLCCIPLVSGILSVLSGAVAVLLVLVSMINGVLHLAQSVSLRGQNLAPTGIESR